MAAPACHGCPLLQEGDMTLGAGGSALLPKQFPEGWQLTCSIPAAEEKGLPVQGDLGSPPLHPLQRPFHGAPACLNMSKCREIAAWFPSASQQPLRPLKQQRERGPLLADALEPWGTGSLP